MAEVVTKVCDSCGAKDAVTFVIQQPPTVGWQVDLCLDCATPIVGWREAARPLKGGRKPYQRFKKIQPDAYE